VIASRPGAAVVHDRRWAVAVAIGGLLALAVSAGDLARSGYSPDEEYTHFAVTGIRASGLPLLPSGLLYDRGLAYSYAAWAASAFSLDVVPAARWVSALCGVAALAVAFVELRRIASAAAAALAVALMAASLPFWVSATTARFYTPFLLGEFVSLALLARGAVSPGTLAALAATAAVTRWTHELAFLLAAVPLAAALLDGPDRRRRWLVRAGAVVAGLVIGQLAIFAVHAAAPPSNGDVMVRRFFLWQVLNLFERPPLDLARTLPAAAATGAAVAVALATVRWRADRASSAIVLAGGVAAALGQLAVAPVLAVAVLPLAGRRVHRAVAPAALGVLAAAAAFWLVALVVAGDAPGAAVARLVEAGVRYPLDMFDFLVATSPWLTVSTLAGLLARAAGGGGEWPAIERALHALWIGWVLWFGIIESGITARYLLLPTTAMAAAIAVDARAIAAAASPRWRVPVSCLAGVLAAVIVVESWRGPLGRDDRAGAARPTIDPAAVAGDIAPDDIVAAPDELTGVLAAGRLDAWLALDEFFRERFVVVRGGQATGTYTGVPAASTLTPLLERAEREQRRLIVVDVLKDAPGFGSMAVLVPRQLAVERLRGEVVAERGGIRLVHVVRAPETAVASVGRAPHGGAVP
jgi:hypothetical protein